MMLADLDFLELAPLTCLENAFLETIVGSRIESR